MECKICNKEFKMITNTHLKFHNITIEDLIKDYREIGFDCIIFWESDVYTNTNTVLEKTLKFINN